MTHTLKYVMVQVNWQVLYTIPICMNCYLFYFINSGGAVPLPNESCTHKHTGQMLIVNWFSSPVQAGMLVKYLRSGKQWKGTSGTWNLLHEQTPKLRVAWTVSRLK